MGNMAFDATVAGGLLTVDLDALRANYITLAEMSCPAECAAVVKADAYGLGAAAVAGALHDVGCRTFFVAFLSEAIALRADLPTDSTIIALNGLQPGSESLCADQGIIPVLNGLDQVEAWSAEGLARGQRLPAVLQVDTGMARLGLSPAEQERLLVGGRLLDGVAVVLVMSHLARADEPENITSSVQLNRFRAILARSPSARGSLSNSAGMLLDPMYRFDLVRPGIALYGVDPTPPADLVLRPTVRLEARVIQIREAPIGTAVGYGGAFVVQRSSRIATIAIGYADGWTRRLGGIGAAFVDGVRLPFVGRVSMDSITLDVTALPAGRLKLGDLVELIGPNQTIADVAAAAGTIPYEILTSLGHRYARRYVGSAVPGSGSASKVLA